MIRTLGTLFRKTVCTAVSVSILFLPGWVYGTETNMSAIGREAQSFGSEQAAGALSDFATTSSEFKSGDFAAGKSEAELMWTPEDLNALKGLFDGSDSAGSEKGSAAKEKLFGDESTVEGKVHAIMIEGYNDTRADLSKDPILSAAEKILKDYEMSDIASCKSDEVLERVQNTVHQPDLQECEQVLDRSGQCRITHDYRAGVIRYSSGRHHFASCGEGCTEVWLGTRELHTYTGKSSKGEQLHEHTEFELVNPDAITAVYLDFALYEDHAQIWVGPTGREQKVYQGPLDCFPFSDRRGPYDTDRVGGCNSAYTVHLIWNPNGIPGDFCAGSTHKCGPIHQGKPAINITNLVKSAGKGGKVNFIMRNVVASAGELYGHMTIHYDAKQAIVDDSWTPPECVQSAVGIDDGFAKGNYVCTNMPKMEGSCALIDGTYVCPHHLNKSPLKNMSNLCMEVAVNADFSFYKGDMGCWTDASGQRVCERNDGGKLDKCQALIDRGCSWVSSTCTEGAQGASRTCYVTDNVYDCGKDVLITDTNVRRETVCEGDIKCTGEDCITIKDETNTSFARVSALMNALEYMSTDMECTGIDEDGHVTGTETVACESFAGNPRKCKIAVGGVQDCCENQNPVGMQPYLQMLAVKYGIDAMKAGIEWLGGIDGSTVGTSAAEAAAHGAWSTAGYMSEVGQVSWGVASYINELSSFVENINCWKDLWFPSIDVMIAHAKTAMIVAAKRAITELFKMAAESLWAEAGGGGGGMVAGDAMAGAASEALAMAGAALGVVAAIYAAYCVAVMLIQQIYKCTEEEMELTAMRDVGSCHYLGSYCDHKVLGVCVKKYRSYCCFNSPLSRIVQEQLRKQGDLLGPDFTNFGSVKHPQCRGIPVEKIGLVDWDRVDLSEWTAILKNNQMFPDETSTDMDSMTGSKSKYNYDGERVDSLTRTESRLKYIDITEEHRENNESIPVDTGYRRTE